MIFFDIISFVLFVKDFEREKMKKMVFGILFVLIFMSIATYADSSYKKSVWQSVLIPKHGILKVRGAGYMAWGWKWVQVDRGVLQYDEKGTSLGPVIIYRKKNGWHIVRLNFRNGRKENYRTFKKPIRVIRKGKYGVIISVGNAVYDYSWNQCKKLN